MPYNIHKLNQKSESIGILKTGVNFEDGLNICKTTEQIKGVHALALIRPTSRGEVVASILYC